MTLADSLRQVIAEKDSLLAAMRAAEALPDTVAVKVLGQHPFLGFFGEASKIAFGAVLALGASWWLESRRRDHEEKRARRPFMIRLETEVHVVLLAMKRLVDSLEPGPRVEPFFEVPQPILEELRPLLENLDALQDRFYLLRNPGIATGLSVWYRRLRITIEQAAKTDLDERRLGISGMEGQPPSPANEERSRYRTRFIELQVEGNRLLDRILKLD